MINVPSVSKTSIVVLTKNIHINWRHLPVGKENFRGREAAASWPDKVAPAP